MVAAGNGRAPAPKSRPATWFSAYRTRPPFTLFGLPVAARVVFELTGKDGGGSAALATAGALGLAAGVVLLVGTFACLAPARRVLAIQANEALRTEG